MSGGTKVRQPPEDFQDLGVFGPGLSNFDHSVDPEAEGLLRGGKVSCRHAADGFNGDVWYEDGMFHECVNVWHVAVAHHEASTLEALMTEVNDEHGWG